ncbi:MAG: hypothetical protein NZ455_09025 [Bacteroidia bacterium]|nr:hypothetical protein [Bacteroidia bacterium]MDW8346307.1 hypothetical protein [Bacteroidia bacterium]
MRRVCQQCGAQRSTEAIAQPVARRPEHQRGTRPKKYLDLILILTDNAVKISSSSR